MMRNRSAWIVVAAVVAVVGVGAALALQRGPKGKDAPAAAASAAPEASVAAATPAASAPVASVSVEPARVRTLLETLNAFGEVSPGPPAGLSFARAGQVTQLHAIAGDRIAKGTLLATLLVDPAGREAYTQATNALAAAQRESSRLHQLLDLQLATRSQVDAADKAVQDATGALRALDAQGGGAPTSTLAAPFDGVVASVSVAQGDRVQAGAPILQLSRADALRVQIGVEPTQSYRVHPGTRVRLLPITAPAAPPVVIAAVVGSVQDIVDAKTQLVSAIVTLRRASAPQLVPGMKVRAVLEVGSRTALAVRRDAVLTDADGDHLYQVVDGKARRVAVTKQLEAGGYVAIAPLSDRTAPVVVVGNHELQDGMAVKVVAP